MFNTSRSNIIHEARQYTFITLGLILYAIGYNCFQLPYQIASGGVAGAAAVIFYGTGFPPSITYFLVNILLLGFAVKILGWRFCIKTIYAVVVLTFLLQAVHDGAMSYAAAHPGEFVAGAQGMPQIVRNDAFMSTILGASLEGIALGIIFLNNGSTGGTDVIAAIVNKYRDITLGQMIMITDTLIITSSLLLPSTTISQLLYGYCTLIISNLLLDFVVDRGRQSVQFLIFSDHYAAIADAIVATHRGVTLLDGIGWYTQSPRKVLVVLAKKRESNNIFRIIQTIDPGAFISQSKVIGVFGYGFDRLKVKTHKGHNQVAPPEPPQSGAKQA